MTRTTLWVAALATSAVTALAAGAAIADDTTIVREHREVQAPAPAPPPAPAPCNPFWMSPDRKSTACTN